MLKILRAFVKSIPTLILAFALAIAVWISAVSASDPIQQQAYPRQITIERIGLSSSLVISNEVPDQVSVTLSAPGSIWKSLLNDRSPIQASMNLTGLSTGTHTLEVKVQSQLQPVKVVSQSPKTVTVTLEELVTKDFPIDLVRIGDPEVGYQADTATLSEETVTISGPASLVSQVKTVRVMLDLQQATDNINRKLAIEVLDADENAVDGLTVAPGEVVVTQLISQRGGYRNVVVKVATSGQVTSGYRLTNISIFPPNVTVFSANPNLVDDLPGFIETQPLDLTGVKDDLEVRLALNLPDGIEVIGDQALLVQVGVAAIEGSITLSDLPIQVTGVQNNLFANISLQGVDVIISGPLPLLDSLAKSDVKVIIDLNEVGEGTYQLAPRVDIAIPELNVESILPSSIEVIVESRKSVTPTSAKPTPTATPMPTPTPGN